MTHDSILTGGGQVTTGGHVTAGGQVTSGGHVIAGGQVKAGGHVIAGGQVTAGGHAIAGGQVTSGGHVIAGVSFVVMFSTVVQLWTYSMCNTWLRETRDDGALVLYQSAIDGNEETHTTHQLCAVNVSTHKRNRDTRATHADSRASCAASPRRRTSTAAQRHVCVS